MYKILTATALAVLTLSSLAQTGQGKNMPSQADIAAKQKETLNALNNLPLTSRDFQLQMKSNAAGANAAAAISSPNLNKSNATQSDFMNLSRPGSGPQPNIAPPKPPQADLMIFVSLSMPDQMLEQYAAQAKRFNAVLMMRGFVNDKLSDTKAALVRLNKAGAQWEISPEPFKQFKIDKVPAIVMATAESGSITEDGCARPETYTTVFGDISVLGALDKMSLRGQKTIADMAKARIMADRQAGK